MEALLRQLRELPGRFQALPGRLKALLIAGVVASLAIAGGVALVRTDGSYEYAFTSLTQEDAAEMGAVLKGAGVAFRMEAGGQAIAVPADKVYDVRLLLAASGLPRGGGVGFELFDKGDFGVSEFTQKVNLRRALEGELARTISRLSEVRTARVHLSLSERGLYRDEDRPAAAAVVLNLRGAAVPSERELSGIRHLVASAVPGLSPDHVTIVDGRGSVLSAETGPAATAANETRVFERDLEQRLGSLLEPVVGPGAVVARVTASFDTSEVQTNAEVVDPDMTAVKSERHLTSASQANETQNGGVVGAAANNPLSGAGGAGSAPKSSANTEDETKNYEVSKTTTKTVARAPRLKRLSIAILLDGVDGKPRADADVTRLGELAKRAVGFDAARGDQFDISSSVFARSTDEKPVEPVNVIPAWAPLAVAGVGAAALLIVAIALVLRRRKPAPTLATGTLPELPANATAADVHAVLAAGSALAIKPDAPPNDPEVELRDKARDLAEIDPLRAARLLRAWLAKDEPATAPAKAEA